MRRVRIPTSILRSILPTPLPTRGITNTVVLLKIWGGKDYDDSLGVV